MADNGGFGSRSAGGVRDRNAVYTRIAIKTVRRTGLFTSVATMEFQRGAARIVIMTTFAERIFRRTGARTTGTLGTGIGGSVIWG